MIHDVHRAGEQIKYFLFLDKTSHDILACTPCLTRHVDFYRYAHNINMQHLRVLNCTLEPYTYSRAPIVYVFKNNNNRSTIIHVITKTIEGHCSLAVFLYSRRAHRNVVAFDSVLGLYWNLD